MERGVPTPTIAEAVFARSLSALKDERAAAAKVLTGPEKEFDGDKAQLLEDIRQALYLSKICSYAQGFALLKEASDQFEWNLDLGQVALIWRGGCIIRARFLDEIAAAFARKPDLPNLLLDPYFQQAVDKGQPAWRRVVAAGTAFGVPVPGFGSALFYYDSYRRGRLPASDPGPAGLFWCPYLPQDRYAGVSTPSGKSDPGVGVDYSWRHLGGVKLIYIQRR